MEKLNKEVYIKRIIVISWIVLAICFIIKLFGGNLFEIICKNETFIAICEFCDNNWWAYFINGLIYCFFSTYFFILAVCQTTKLQTWQTITTIGTIIIGCIIKTFDKTIGVIFDVWQMIIMPLIFLIKTPKKLLNIVIGNILVVIFQLVSLITKNINIGFLGDSVLIGNIFAIDVLIMVILYFAYANLIKIKKEGK